MEREDSMKVMVLKKSVKYLLDMKIMTIWL